LFCLSWVLPERNLARANRENRKGFLRFRLFKKYAATNFDFRTFPKDEKARETRE